MLAKLPADQALKKAQSHVKKGEVAEAQKIYQSVFKSFSKQAKDLQENFVNLNNIKDKNLIKNPPQEVVNKLISLYKNGQFSIVVEQAQALVKQYPETFIFWNILGASAVQIGMADQAIIALKKVISMEPNYADAYSNISVALQEQGKLDEAIAACKKALLLNPNKAGAYYNIANVLKDQNKLDEAIENYKKSISLKPDYVEAYCNLATVLKDQIKLDEALKAIEKSITLKPDYAVAFNNMGNILKDQCKFEEAIKAFKKAISLNSNFVQPYNNMGVVLQDQGKLDEAIDAYKKAITIKPDYAEAHLNLSLSLLQSGQIKEGLEEYEFRLKTKEGVARQRHFPKPQWDGQTSLKDKTILLYSEQGIGDTMNWSSCLSLVSSRAKHVMLECQEKLVPLLSRSFPNVEVKAQDRSLDTERDDFDLHLPMGSLYKYFIDEMMEKGKANSYLIPDPARIQYWKERMGFVGKGPYIGVCWKSSVKSAYRLQHYPPMSDWAPVFKVPDVTFINLQYTDYEDDIAKVENDFGVKIHNFEDIDQYGDIDEVAALTAALDMVVSTKATPPMISAGVGTPTKIANWRQSNYNTILTNPQSTSLEMIHRDTYETWDKVFNSIADHVLKVKNEIA